LIHHAEDTIYIEKINPYNSQGELVYQHYNNILFIGPVQCIEYAC